MKIQRPRRSPRPQQPTSAAHPTRDLAVQIFGGQIEHRLALLRAAWRSSVGPELARRTEVVAIDGKMLRVRVPDVQWQSVLHRMRRDILRRLAETAGALAPSALGFHLGPVTTNAGEPPPHVPEKRAVEVAVPESIEQAAAVIDDPEIRSRFAHAAARYLQAMEKERVS